MGTGRGVVTTMEHRPLGGSGIDVSALSLGSWRTFERIPREAGLAVMTAARDHGIDFLDDARYDDETGAGPLATGNSEVVFGELFRAAGWKRDEVIVANKLWWEFWPEQTAAQELDASCARMRFEYVDLIYAERLPAGLSVYEAVSEVSELIAGGKARAWGVLNWPAQQIVEAAAVTSAERLYDPCAAQLPYSLAQPGIVESREIVAALDEAGASVVASAVLANGALTGKYTDGTSGRLDHEREHPRRRRAFRIGRQLREVADRMDTTPASLALAFALSNPRVASVLFGATMPQQVGDNVRALALLSRLTDRELTELRDLAAR